MKNSYLETIKSVDGEISNIRYHQSRYESVLSSLGVEKFEELQTHIKAPERGVYRCRLIYTEDGIREVTYHEYKKRDISSFKLIFNNDIDYSVKSAVRDEIDALYEQRGECDEILIIKDLLVTDTSIANIAFYKNGEWYTPKTPLLKGTTRARLLDEGRLLEADIKVQDIRSFSQVALLNAMIGFDVLQRHEFLI